MTSESCAMSLFCRKDTLRFALTSFNAESKSQLGSVHNLWGGGMGILRGVSHFLQLLLGGRGLLKDSKIILKGGPQEILILCKIR